MATWDAATKGSWNVTVNTFSKNTPATSWESYIVSTGEALGSAEQTATCKCDITSTSPSAWFIFQSGDPTEQDNDMNGWGIQFYPSGGSQKAKVRIDGAGTDYPMTYDSDTEFKIKLTPTAVYFYKDDVVFHTETTWLPDSATT